MDRVVKQLLTGLLVLVSVGLLAACRAPEPDISSKLNIVATTTLVGDVVKQVGGDQIELVILLPVNADPHTFEPRPQDIAAINQADMVFVNGLGFEETLEQVLQTNLSGTLVEVSAGITPLEFEEHDEEHAESEGDEQHLGDPHTWTDPNNVRIWAQNIAAALAQADPGQAAFYQANAQAYQQQLTELDQWIREQVATIPAERRKLVTDHATLGYFAKAYGFAQSGLVIGSFSSNASPSAQELAQLEDVIREQGVPAVFAGNTVNPALAQQVAPDTGIQLVLLYTDSLSQAGGDAETYLQFMRYNVTAIVQALK